MACIHELSSKQLLSAFSVELSDWLLRGCNLAIQFCSSKEAKNFDAYDNGLLCIDENKLTTDCSRQMET